MFVLDIVDYAYFVLCKVELPLLPVLLIVAIA